MKKEIYIQAIKKSGLKKSYIASQIGANQTQFSRWLNGNTNGGGLTQSQIIKLHDLLKNKLN